MKGSNDEQDLLDVSGSVFWVVLAEDGEGGDDGGCAFGIIVLDHYVTYIRGNHVSTAVIRR